MNVLVLGGSGVVGGAVAQELRRTGHTVTMLARRPVPGGSVRGDVRRPGLGLAPDDAAALRERTTHIVSCFGSVSLDAGPRTMTGLHVDGTENVLAFTRTCRRLRFVVHVSSVLVFGRCPHPVGNADLDVGQGFRNWYEYGKFAAERLVRAAHDVPVGVLRLGPVLGVDGPVHPGCADGVLAALPHVLTGRPVPLAHRGGFPCYAGDSTSAAVVVREALRREPAGQTWTWFDPAHPTLAQVLAALCAAWAVVPRIVDVPLLSHLSRALAPRFGIHRQLCDYLAPWVRLDRDILRELPFPAPSCPDRYLERTGEALRAHSVGLFGVAGS